MLRLIVLTASVLSGCAVGTHEETTQFLLIVRERLRPGSNDAYWINTDPEFWSGRSRKSL